MPNLDVSELNVVLRVVGLFMVGYAMISVKLKAEWHLGEALPAVIFGIIVGPIASRFLDATRWGLAVKDQREYITLGMTRVVIGIQLVMAGFQLPPKYFYKKWLPMFICLIPLMTIMWLFTTGCVLLAIPRLSLLAAMVIASCVTCADPVLSQAVAKGPFADKFVPRPVREIISAEAASNDGFGFPFLMLATYLIRHAINPISIRAQIDLGNGVLPQEPKNLVTRAEDFGRIGGGHGLALKNWVLETCLYFVVMSIIYGAVIGHSSLWAVKYSLRKKWIDTESYLLFPTALGLFIIGTCGAIGVDDLLACTVAGAALNWDGEYLSETLKLHDEVNSSIDVLLNFGGFVYIGTILPFKEFHQPNTTGITFPLLLALGVLVLLFRRIPGVFILYRFMPSCVMNWKDAFFMGYFGPIGIGAVFYVEHTKHLFPRASEIAPGDTEVANLLTALAPIVYWLVFFSIVVHGLSIPILNAFYKFRGVEAIQEDNPVEIPIRSNAQAQPKNSQKSLHKQSVMVHNRFSVMPEVIGETHEFGQPTIMPGWNERERELKFDEESGSSEIGPRARSLRFEDQRAVHLRQ